MMLSLLRYSKEKIRHYLVGDCVVPVNTGPKYSIWVSIREIVNILHFITVFFSIKNITRIATWKLIKKQKKRDRLVIISGGPSISEREFNYLKKNRDRYDLMVLNYFTESDFSATIVPDYYVVSDPESLNSNQARLQAKSQKLRSYLKDFDGVLFHSDAVDANAIDCQKVKFIDIESKLLGGCLPWLPRAYRSNTSAKAIELALYLGFSDIYVFGFDYDFTSRLSYTIDKGIGVIDKHHYGETFESWNDTFVNPAHVLSWLAADLRSFEAIQSPRVKLVSDASFVHAFEKLNLRALKI